MPGIIPMKVIKVGNSTQSRIAQACDRCRSKKIRCDGFRPSCSQCSQVGFECKTSDKLSRRAFPRGYTESLEERVRSLEREVNDFKELLDAKDEKIDMLSRLRSNSSSVSFATRPASSPKKPSSSPSSSPETFRVQQTPSLIHGENEDTAYFAGSSSSRSFIEALKGRFADSGRASPTFETSSFFPSDPGCVCPVTTEPIDPFWSTPPRIVSDQMVNVFFQEWAPLFPVLHRPTFLALYERYVSDAGAIHDSKSLAQLHLVFGIAAVSSSSRIQYDVTACERQWLASMNQFATEVSLSHVQCLALAQLYCIQKGDYTKFLHYKSLAVGISYRLGLHCAQHDYNQGALACETRKKVFWTLYTFDCFSAAMFGLPRMFKDENIDCEYPADTDDEYITESGFQPTLPGEFTKLSSALALFRGSRILSKVLDINYPSGCAHDITIAQICDLETELDEWLNELPAHLRLTFENERPSTNVVSSRCPLLSLTYHFIRSLIHRPALTSNNDTIQSSSLLKLASSSKHIVQIIQLLNERSLSFSHCLNRNEVFLLAGFGLLLQSVHLGKDSKLLKDNQRTVCSVIEMLEGSGAPGAHEFKRLGCSMLSIRRSSNISAKQPEASLSSGSKPRTMSQGTASRRRASLNAKNKSGNSNVDEANVYEDARQHQQDAMQVSPPDNTVAQMHSSLRKTTRWCPDDIQDSATLRPGSLPRVLSRSGAAIPNLDYFSFTGGKNSPHGRTPEGEKRSEYNVRSMKEDERLLGRDVASSTVRKLSHPHSLDSSTAWSPDAWNLPTDLLDSTEPAGKGVSVGRLSVPHSVFSLSEESLTSGEEFSSIDFGSLDSEDALKAFIHANVCEEEQGRADLEL